LDLRLLPPLLFTLSLASPTRRLTHTNPRTRRGREGKGKKKEF